MTAAAPTFRFYTSNIERAVETVAKEPQVARETEYYRSKIEEIKSLDEFMADSRVFRYALEAYGLGEMSYAKAFFRKILEEGVDEPDSLANRLTDQRYTEFAKDFNFKRYGDATTTFERVRGGVVDRYHRQAMEEAAGASNDGARLALYFQRRAGEIDSPYDILADEALLKTVQVALGLPAAMSYLDIDKQAEMITSRLDLAELSDPQYLSEFLTRFVTLWDVENPEAIPVPAIAPIGSTVQSISTDLLATLQNIKTRG